MSCQIQPPVRRLPLPFYFPSEWFAAVAENTAHRPYPRRSRTRCDSHTNRFESFELRKKLIDHRHRQCRNGTRTANNGYSRPTSAFVKRVDAHDKLSTVGKINLVASRRDGRERHLVILLLKRTDCIDD